MSGAGRTVPACPRRRLTPDTLLSIHLSAILSRGQYDDPAGVIAAVRAAAGDRDDLLAEAVGLWVGSEEVAYRPAPGLASIREAFADVPGIGEWIETGRRRASAGGHGINRAPERS